MDLFFKKTVSRQGRKPLRQAQDRPRFFVGFFIFVFALSTVLQSIPLPTLAIDVPNTVFIDTINGLPPTSTCIAGAITIEGHGMTGTNGGPYGLDIKWGDGSITTLSLPPGGEDTFTFTETHIPTQVVTNTFGVFLYHGSSSGNDAHADITSFCATPATTAVLTVKKHVDGGVATAPNFTIRVKNGSNSDVADGGNGVSSPTSGSETGEDFIITPDGGVYTVTEDAFVGYTQTSAIGDCSIVLEADNNYSCTLTNTYTPTPNASPTITLNGATPVELVVNVDTYSELGATADDAEDGQDITVSNIDSSSVDTNTIGSYSVFYNFTDSDGAAATEVIRTVNVVAGDNECNDTLDNDGDGSIDYPADLGCDSIDDLDENEPPVITMLGDNPLELVVNVDSYSELGATADDAEDGQDISVIDIVHNVNTAIIGVYQAVYNFTDSNGAAATEKTRNINVVAGNNECNDATNNDSDGLTDFPLDLGCESVDDPSENEPPVITLTNSNPQVITLNNTYSELGATADDAEDGQDITVSNIDSSSVDTNTIGSYSVFYNFTDSDGAAAAEAIREVQVKTACSDGIDNDNDGNTDLEEDAGCENSLDNNENAAPTITLTGNDPINLLVGDSYIENGATAHDEEDGDNPATIGGDSVNTGIVGSYTVTYNYTDADGLSATQITRTINISSQPQCSDDSDNDNDGRTDIDDPGCHTDGNPENQESYDTDDNNELSQYTLTVTTNDSDGNGVVTGNGIDCDSNSEEDDCTETYNEGMAITLTATPDEGSNFNNSWSGACTGNNLTCTVNITTNQNVNAHFGLNIQSTPTPTPSPTPTPTPSPIPTPTPTPTPNGGGGGGGPQGNFINGPLSNPPQVAGASIVATPTPQVAGALTVLPATGGETENSALDKILLSFFTSLMLTGGLMLLVGYQILPKAILKKIR